MGVSNRRGFLTQSLVAAGGLGLGYFAWSNLTRANSDLSIDDRLGKLLPVNDLTTGLPLLKLPEGFSYRTLAWAGEALSDGNLSPGNCDGMGVINEVNGVITLIRNHELRGSDGAIGGPQTAWDNTGGGTTTLRFDSHTAALIDSRVSLGGTLNNCAGGVTPWGTWLSCEEAVFEPVPDSKCLLKPESLWQLGKACKAHGFVFEVPADGAIEPKPIVEMGQFRHEAAAVDPVTGIVYMTEDQSPYAGFYRFIPDVPGQLHAGGQLQMMQVNNHDHLITTVPADQPMTCQWVDIPNPAQGHSPGSSDGAGVVNQGLAAGATAFQGLEGCIWEDGVVYFTSKTGGAASAGLVFRFDIEAQALLKVFEATDPHGFSGMDNLIMSPQGSLMMCEDRVSLKKTGQHIAGINPEGRVFDFCQINTGLYQKHAGHDLSSTAAYSEWAGVCFSLDGQWMFANIYSPGVTVAITGPWAKGPV